MSRSALLHFWEKFVAAVCQAFGRCAEGIVGLQYFESLPIQLKDDGARQCNKFGKFQKCNAKCNVKCLR